MTFKKLEVPTASITDVKKSPTEVFKIAEQTQTGVYIFNREKVAGVMISQAQYEILVGQLQGDLELPKRASKEVAPEQSMKEKTFKSLEAEKVFKKFSHHSFTLKALDDELVDLGFITKKSSYGGTNLMENELMASEQLAYRNRSSSQCLLLSLIPESATHFRIADVQ
ncbi:MULTISPECIES: type II toxin-antitoxin system Phd/YefM family antitoxin [unclassified Enterococcus]|uniref:type II toxin-antitoxin system Phd/YefM family antitoxin n=1 Tax=unclassified Enterococcus TaxID=2608891 RepID=UPI001554EEC9|nr:MULTISPECIES: type II toxin-antitoxin system Phd/YefM family antitoxin [unclassified Enterococcus]MBS7577575.1 type II toxin-antitoxin system Phd/YefM family antitoxin [Enterococcus sp. MMGLQ5-2]MBS7584926.1 type II toxin-antitoxin system Phd/YefM family antitoxin [Enterococcus sp. MMGLQ5-1]NPD12781.1 type II toxin-antitoxin system Phd/YefM family antitoxin [Enterococcus sp. MMGLQ5-1]NPD37408.1 type II toxin-antitoxin system Phd/YefM family antitoxin [Enterococcus sp. MMGLQ5-2]